MTSELVLLQKRVVACTRCPRLTQYTRQIAIEKRRMYSAEDYWGRPLPSFGDSRARLLVLGLAPAAHGGNRTGRMLTGDRSGDFLYRALYDAGFASQPSSRHRNDGLKLHDCYITAALRCAPPDNKPSPEELRNCRPYLEQEFRFLVRLRAVLALGRIAFDTCVRLAFSPKAGHAECKRHPASHAPGKLSRGAGDQRVTVPSRQSIRFAHGAVYELPDMPRLFASYHPSQQNTQTGKLTPAMLRAVLEKIRLFLDDPIS